MGSKEAKEDPYTIFATNPDSKFTPFSIQLKNGATLTGISHIPSSGPFSRHAYKPLLIGIHGATCSAHNYDPHPSYSASIYSSLTEIPFVAFNRPNFLGSSGWLHDDDADTEGEPRFKLPEGSTMFEEEARWYNSYILPALWEKFGLQHGCTSLVTTSHSMAVPVTIIAAGLYSQTPLKERMYPWAGMIAFGLGEDPLQTVAKAQAKWPQDSSTREDLPFGHDPKLHIGPFHKEDKLAMMLGPPGCCEAFLEDLCWRQNVPFFLDEVIDLNGVWIQKKVEFKSKVRIPVLYGIGTMEWLWKADKEHLEMFMKDFVNCPRIEGAVVEGAPHGIEWSRMAGGWWLRVFGWSVEVSTGLGMEGMKLPRFE